MRCRLAPPSVVAAAALAVTLGGCGSTAPGGNENARRTAGAPLPAAVAPWSTVTARDLPDAAPTQAAGLSFGPRGASLLSWAPPQREEGVPSPQTRVAVFGPRSEPGRTATIPRSLAGRASLETTDGQAPSLDAGRGVRAPTYRYSSDRGPHALGLTTVPPTGGPAKTVPVDLGHPVLGSFDVAVGPTGDAAVVWTESTRPEDDAYVKARLRVAFAPAGQARFGAPTTLLASDRALEPYGVVLAVGLGDDGRVVVAADSLAFGDSGEDGLLVWKGRPDDLGDPVSITTGQLRDLEVAVTSTGRSIVAWAQQGGGEEASTGYVVKATSFDAGADRAGATQTLDPGSLKAYAEGGLALATGPEGSVTFAWSGVGRKSYPASVVTAGADGRFGAPQQLARNGTIGGLRIRDDGAAVVTVAPPGNHPADTVERDPNGEERSVAFTRAAGSARFGPAERLPLPKAPAGRGPLIPTPAFDPVSGRPAIAYVVASPKGSKGAPARLVVVTRDGP